MAGLTQGYNRIVLALFYVMGITWAGFVANRTIKLLDGKNIDGFMRLDGLSIFCSHSKNPLLFAHFIFPNFAHVNLDSFRRIFAEKALRHF